MHRDMLRTPLVEDLNRLGCPEEQERYAKEPLRAREALERLRWIDTSDLGYYHRRGWISRHELGLLERFFGFASERLGAIPSDANALEHVRSDPSWEIVRERTRELLQALDAFTDIGVPGWGHQYRPTERGADGAREGTPARGAR